MLEVRITKRYGRGVYATVNMKAGDLIEASPVIVLDEWEADQIVSTVLNCYAFAWGDGTKSAIAMGFGGLFNHSKKDNVIYQENFQNKTIDFVTRRDIRKGEQLFIDYGYSAIEAIKDTKFNRSKAEKERK